MLKEERWDSIERFVEANGYASIADLTSLTDASRATIHRDLDSLAKDGRISLIHGGAVSIFNKAMPESSYEEKTTSNAIEKDCIAKYVADYIKPGEKVFIDSGTTTLRLVPYLMKMQDITVISNDVQIIARLYNAPDINVKMIGGNLRRGYYSMIGYYAEQYVKDMKADIGIIGADSVSENGISIANDDEVGIKRAIISSSNKVIVVADHSKLGKDSFAKVCALDDIDYLVTGSEASSLAVVKNLASKCKVKFASE